MYENKMVQMIDFVELLRSQSYDDIYNLKARIGDEKFAKLEDIYEHLKNETDFVVKGSTLDAIEQEKTIDLNRLDNMEVDLTDILRMLLCTNLRELQNLKLKSKNYYVTEIYKDIYKFFQKEKVEQIPLMLTFKLTSLVN